MGAGLYQALVDEGLLIPHAEVSPYSIEIRALFLEEF